MLTLEGFPFVILGVTVETADDRMVDILKLFLGYRFANGAKSQLYHGIYNDEVVAVKIIRVLDDDDNEEFGSMAGVDINTLTMEQHLALLRDNQASGVVKPEIGGNVNFEIKSQFMRELREDTFSGNKNEDAHDHVDRVLNIVDRLIPGTVNTWDLLKKAFIQRYIDSSNSTHLYSNPNTDPDRMPLTKAKAEAAIESKPGLMMKLNDGEYLDMMGTLI
ncbi:hypothetical protein Tco_0370925 [Tanacetum coccineum]